MIDPPFLAFPLRGKEMRTQVLALISFPLRGKARKGGSITITE